MPEVLSHETLVDRPNYEVVSIDPEVIASLRNFIRNEVEKNRKFPNDPERKEFNGDFGWNGNDSVKAVETYGDPEKSFVVIARKNSEIVGFSITGITEDKKIFVSFVGVEFNSLRQGIATELVRKKHDVLRQMGYKEYVAHVWEASKRTIEKALGKPIEPLPDDSDNQSFRVRLD